MMVGLGFFFLCEEQCLICIKSSECCQVVTDLSSEFLLSLAAWPLVRAQWPRNSHGQCPCVSSTELAVCASAGRGRAEGSAQLSASHGSMKGSH